jgi:uncharacterized protein (DUF2235 family)
LKRIVICYDGTWNALTNPDEVTNVVRVAQAVKPVSSDGIPQVVYYNAGVGSGGPLDRFLGGVFGAGLRDNVKRGLAFLSLNWEAAEAPEDGDTADEIYIFGFSRGAYTARALAGVISAIGGIPRQASFDQLERIWNHYRMTKEQREADKDFDGLIWKMPKDGKPPIIKCVAVWDTVGSYGIPTGFGFAGLARKFTAWTRGFHDNEIGPHIEYGLHAMAIDEWRRAFTATAWVNKPGEDRQNVEQVWFAGAHSNVGGGYKQAGLSDHALIWMIARTQKLTGLEFDADYIKEHFWPCAACSLFRSYRGWVLDRIRPSVRPISTGIRVAKELMTSDASADRIINAKVHWSVRDRVGKLGLVDETKYRRYSPKNLPKDYPTAEQSEFERELIDKCRAHREHPEIDSKTDEERSRTMHCVLHRKLTDPEQGWRGRRLRRLRDEWKDVLAARSQGSTPLRPDEPLRNPGSESSA